MTDLRALIVPDEAAIEPGYYLRWPELRLWLLDHEQKDLANEIERTLIEGEDVRPARQIIVPRVR